MKTSHKKIVCIGDSLTAGYEIPLNKRWSDIVTNTVGIEIINKGIKGDTTSGMLSRFSNIITSHQPNYVIIMGGTNDIFFNVPFSTILSNIHSMSRIAKHCGVFPIIGIPTGFYARDEQLNQSMFTDNRSLSSNIYEYQKLLKQYVEEDGQTSIDFGYNMKENYFLKDGFHPNETGHNSMAKVVVNCLEKLIFNERK